MRAVPRGARGATVDHRQPRDAASAQPRVDVPPGGARLVGSGAERALVWADTTGVWTAPLGDLEAEDRRSRPRRRCAASCRAPTASARSASTPTRSSPTSHHKKPAEVLMTLRARRPRRAPQGDPRRRRRRVVARLAVGARPGRRAARASCARAAASTSAGRASPPRRCRATAAGPSCSATATARRSRSRRSRPQSLASRPRPGPRRHAPPAEPPDGRDAKPWDTIDEPSDEPEAGAAPPANDDVSVAPPSGPLSLYRLRLEGAFTDRPTLLVKVVDGAAVWAPRAP